MPPRTQSTTDSRLHLRPRRSRCKTGCLCCRLRKKKCDEQKPVCASCNRLGLTCSWLKSGEFAWRIGMGFSNSDPASALRELGDMVSSPLVRSGLVNAPEVADSMSQRLLQRYVEQITPHILTISRGTQNPFVKDVLPLAFSDALVMNAVLAVGGSAVTPTEADKAEEERILQCYGEAVGGLKSNLTDWIAGTEEKSDSVRLFLTIVLLVLFEIMRGNKDGILLHHLRAGRLFTQALYAYQDPAMRSLIGILLELYAFWELCFSLRVIPSQADIDALVHSPTLSLERLCEYDTFGIVFAGSSALFWLIPQICQLTLDRDRELAEGVQDQSCEEKFQSLTRAITGCDGMSDPTSVYYETVPDEGEQFARGKRAANIVTKNALMLFLWSAYFKEDSVTCELSQPLVDMLIEVLPDIQSTCFSSYCFWPIFVTASYAITEEQRTIIRGYFTPILPLLVRAVEILGWVWDSSGRVPGLQGLARAVESRKTCYCFG